MEKIKVTQKEADSIKTLIREERAIAKTLDIACAYHAQARKPLEKRVDEWWSLAGIKYNLNLKKVRYTFNMEDNMITLKEEPA